MSPFYFVRVGAQAGWLGVGKRVKKAACGLGDAPVIDVETGLDVVQRVGHKVQPLPERVREDVLRGRGHQALLRLNLDGEGSRG